MCNAFYECTGLTTLIFEDGNEYSLRIENGFTGAISLSGTSYHGAFSGCNSLTEITLPERLSYLGQYAFCGCSNLEKVYLPAALEKIGRAAFSGSGLKTLRLPKTVLTLGNSAFAGSALQEVTFESNVAFFNESGTAQATNLFDGCADLRTVNLSKDFTQIGNYMFRDCTSLESINLPEGFQRIGNYAFAGSGIKRLELPDSLSSYNSSDTMIGTFVFQNSALEYIKLGTDVRYLNTSMFANCTSLKTVILSPNTSNINNNVFQNCTALKSIVIPKSLTLVSSTTAIISEGWTEDQTVYFEASERDIYGMWGYSWDSGCNAKMVFNYTAPQD